MEILNTFYGRLIKAFMAITICTLVMLGIANSAMALGSTSSDSSEGMVQLNDIQESSKETLRNGPRSAQAIQSKSARGLNGVQGDADSEKMNTPANSQQAETIEEEIKDTLDKITAKN